MIALLIAMAPVAELPNCVVYPRSYPKCGYSDPILEKKFRVSCLGRDYEEHPCDSRQEDAHCIWLSDGTIEAKNATCTDDRRGVRK